MEQSMRSPLQGKRENGQPWVMFSFYGGGHGGSIETDGLNHGNAPISTATIPPMEILEAAYPVMFRTWALRPDSAGTGAHRGGLGAIYEIEVLEQNGAEAFLFGERGSFAPKGIAGGGDAALNVFQYEQDDGWHSPPLTSKMRGINLKAGQAVRLQTPGGGGYGKADVRSHAAIARDVARGLVSDVEADAVYGTKLAEGHRMSSLMIGVDVGGTFTDIFVLNEAAGTARVAKVPTTRPDQSRGFLDGIKQEVSDFSQISVVVHGTTAGTNALLERKGAKTGVICTQGLRDVLEMRRRDRPRTWGLRGNFEPVVDRRNRLEVPERTLADGTVRTPVDLEAVRSAAQALQTNGCESVAILFANSYANTANEEAAVALLREIWHNQHVSASSEILPEIREFERFSTTALNSYLQPEVSGYFARLENALKADGFVGEFMIVQSNGGVMAVDTACRLPVRTALSGPAAGVIAAAYIAQSAGFENVITWRYGRHKFRRVFDFTGALDALASDLN
jgi:hypothetical protein